MTKVMALLVLIAATLILISLTVFSSDGTFGDAKTQKDRAHTMSQTTTVPSALP
ncbi:hypothetical protein DFQ01_110114 [Paenibacillus cellulosilyticus]|uniref:Uncharacterized protein n=1 Tax=Paenibacillus cellulosilyticus TaxID=375489 RepID=A0A2V2YWB1_9BACL|nr:hypothetical protein [Paenibacillus cellulosilyticus]PWW01224.1 hypothetical protein DFQ01_110114 [Paenibacillus cellulosilyticus]QKS46821.1 hypothetical protein HUB94_20270 [Paenibacillus cellulosilyticus]